MRRSRSLASSYCSASARDNSDWDVWAFKAKLRRRSGTRCLGLEVSTVKREACLLVTAICTRAPYTTFDKLRQVSQASIVENKHLGAVLSYIRERQIERAEARSQSSPRRQGQLNHMFKVG